MFKRRRIPSLRFFVSALVAAICLSRLASAQTPPPAVRVGQTVWVNTVDGREFKGKITSLSATEIRVQTGPNLTPVLWPQVRLIETPDSIWNGMVIGAIIGGVSGLALAVANDCSSNECGEVYYAPGGAAIGAAVGTGIDLLRHGRHVLYRAPQTQTSFRILLAGQVRGAGISWRF